jgi:ribosome maturation factor RimP
MITAEQIQALITPLMENTDLFLVEVNVRPGNKIEVILDSDSGLTIEQCTEVHRHILRELDRDVEDYSLDVSSPDISKPLKISRQYIKNIGREVAVKLRDKSKFVGELIAANDMDFTIRFEEKILPEGKKKKEVVVREVKIEYTNAQETKVQISFK